MNDIIIMMIGILFLLFVEKNKCLVNYIISIISYIYLFSFFISYSSFSILPPISPILIIWNVFHLFMIIWHLSMTIYLETLITEKIRYAYKKCQ